MHAYLRALVFGAAAVVLAGVVPPAALAAEDGGQAPPADGPALQNAIPEGKRSEILGKDWKSSDDRAWTTTGDASGFHLLTAPQSTGYTWKTVATLREDGFDADAWIGNACVTGSGRRAVVVYAPRTFTNKAQLMARGGFAAVVDLETSKITKLALQTSLSYYNPGCGAGETAVLTQSAGEDKGATRLFRVDTETGTINAPIQTPGQITSAVPVKDGGIVAAAGAQLVRVGDDGRRSTVARTDAVPYRLTPDGDGGVVFLDSADTTARTPASANARAGTASAPTSVKRVTAAQLKAADAVRTSPEVLAEGPLTGTGLTRSGGTVYVTGDTKQKATKLPGVVHRLQKAPKDAVVSTRGRSVVNQTAWADGKDSRIGVEDAGRARSVAVDLTVIDTGRPAAFVVDPVAPRSSATPSEPSPVLPQPKAAAASGTSPGSSTEIVESDRSCSVPRNDPRNQAMQPKPRQVEWAVDQAVKGTLTLSRPANWKNLGMPAYQPASLFPTVPLEGGGSIPAQVLLGVTAQESNMWQAARSALPGETANPLIGNYYGLQLYDGNDSNDWDIDWSKADCGYGVTQVTDHMRLAGRENAKGGAAWDYQKQRAVALDYAANIAAGMQILTFKWNETRQAGMTVNNGNSAKIENWFFALWAYNSGFYPQADAGNNGGKWGVGWANNPANPEWDESRNPFLEDSSGNNHYADAAHPQNWPYPEKVIGFAGHPVEGLEAPNKTVAGFRAAWWNGSAGGAQSAGTATYNRARAKPPISLFCTTDNHCDPGKISTSASNSLGGGPCTLADFHCWWNKPAQWKSDCDYSCGNELVRFDSTYPEEADGTSYPPNCSTTGLPAGALIIDDAPDGVPIVRSGCSRTWTSAGSFSMDFGTGEVVKDQNGSPTTGWPAKIDLHQLGGGFGGHFYFGHTRQVNAKSGRLRMSATWKLDRSINGPARVFVHLPDHGAETTQAQYVIDTAKGTRTRIISQRGTTNRWVSLGAYLFDGAPAVHLSTVTADGTGDDDIAFDAIAISPISARWVDHTFDAVSLVDPHQGLDTNTPSPVNTPIRTQQTLYDWAMNKTVGGAPWYDSSKPRVRGITEFPECVVGSRSKDCVAANTLTVMRSWAQQVAAAGTSTTGPTTEAQWMGFTNPVPNPNVAPGDAFRSDLDYKFKTDMRTGFLVDDQGKVIPDSVQFDIDWRAGNTPIVPFIASFVKATVADYKSAGVTMPDLSYEALDSNVFSGGTTHVKNPLESGWMPARAYMPHYDAPAVDGSGTCVNAKSIGGAVDAYRPLGGAPNTDQNFHAYVNQLQAAASNGQLPQEIADTAGDFYNMFFRKLDLTSASGSLFQSAPPIWQEISIAFCADGSIKSTHIYDSPDTGPGIVYQGYMPDLYLYHNGKQVDNAGNFHVGPVQRGDFAKFSNIPGVTSDAGNAYGKCDIAARGRGGNPWDISVPPITGANDTPKRVIYCDDKTSHTGVTPGQ